MCKDGSSVRLDPVAPAGVSSPAELHAARTSAAIISRATKTIGFRTVGVIMWWPSLSVPLSDIRPASATPLAWDVALGDVIRDLDRCLGPVRRSSRTRPGAHAGR